MYWPTVIQYFIKMSRETENTQAENFSLGEGKWL